MRADRAVLALLVALALLARAPARAAEIATYDVRLALAEDGSGQASLSVHLAAAAPGVFDLPLAFAAPRDVRLVRAPAGTTLAVLPQKGAALVRLTLPAGVPAELDVELEAELEAAAPGVLSTPSAKSGGRRTFRHSFLNTQPAAVGRYDLEVVFPAGWRAHAIREALPRLRPAEVGPRAQLDAIDGRAGARLHAGRLEQGESAGLQIELVERSRSPLWWIVGVALSTLYLIGFSDLVRQRT